MSAVWGRAVWWLALGLLVIAGLRPSPAHARKPENVFRGQAVVTKKRLKTRYPSGEAFIAALKKNRISKVWPKVQTSDEDIQWTVEYVAFFKRPLNDTEVRIVFYDITGRAKVTVASMHQYTSSRKTRVYFADARLSTPDFQMNHRYEMVLYRRRTKIASAKFWLRAKRDRNSGRVEFSDEEAE